MAEKKYEPAIRELDVALTLTPQSFEALFNKAICYLATEKYDAAVTIFNAAIQLEPEYTEAFYYRGIAKQKNNDPSGACNDFKIAAQAGNIDAENAIKENCRKQ